MSGTSKAADCACKLCKCVMRDLFNITFILVVILVVIEQVIVIQVVIWIVITIITIWRFIFRWALFIQKTFVIWRSAEERFSILRTIHIMGGFEGVIIVRQEFNEMSDRGRRVGLLKCLQSGPWNMTGRETAENIGSFWTMLVALENAKGFKFGG